MTVNYSIDLGQIVQVVVLIGAVVGAHFSLKGSLGEFRVRLDGLERRFTEAVLGMSTRMERHEESITKVTGELQRVIGRLEPRHDGR